MALTVASPCQCRSGYGALSAEQQTRRNPAAPQLAASLVARVAPRSRSLQLRGRPAVAHKPHGGRRVAVCAAAPDALGPEGHGNVKQIQSEEDFDKYMAEAGDRLVVLDIATKTCGPCKFIYPKVVKMSLEYTDVVFLKIYGDYSEGTRALMRKWGVRAVPNFRFFRSGELLHSHSGAKEEDLRSNLLKFYTPSTASV